MRIPVAIDHGNRAIKTINHVFPASFAESSFLPGIGANDVLKFKEKTYTLADESLPVMNDKTIDERYYILTLFALGKELEERTDLMRVLTPNEVVKVDLLVGLPLSQ